MKKTIFKALAVLLILHSSNLFADSFDLADERYNEYQPISEYLPELHSSGLGLLEISSQKLGMPFWQVLEMKGDFEDSPVVQLSIEYIDALQKDLSMIQELTFDQWLLVSNFIVKVN